MRKAFLHSGIFIMIGGWLVSGVSANTTSNRYERATLRGLKEVNVVVEPLYQGRISDSLPLKEIQARVETQLHDAEIKTVPPKKAIHRGNVLAVTIAVMLPDSLLEGVSDVYVYTVDVSLRQRVFLVRRRWLRTSAITWYASATVLVRKSQLMGSVQATVKERIKTFIDDYHREN